MSALLYFIHFPLASMESNNSNMLLAEPQRKPQVTSNLGRTDDTFGASIPIHHRHYNISMKRVKVTWKETKLVVPCGNSSERVFRLLHDITQRYLKYAADFDQANYFVELRTADGYLLDKTDYIDDVIGDGEEIVAIDYNTWIVNFKKNADLELWTKIGRPDFVENKDKWVKISHSQKFNRIFIEFGVGSEAIKFRVYDLDSLSFTTPGDLLDEIQGGDPNREWFCSAHWDPPCAIEIRVKSGSNPRAQVSKIDVLDDNIVGRFIKGTITTTQTSFLELRKTSYPLPAPVAEGPTLRMDGYAAPIDISAIEIVSVGDSSVQLQQIGKPFAEQVWNGSRGAHQKVSVEFMISNISETSVSVILVVAEYMDHDGNWKAATARSGQKSSEYWYDMKSAHDAIISFEPNSVFKLSLQLETPIDITQYKSHEARLRRIHSSFPDPLQIRFTLTDQHKRNSIIAVQAMKGPPNVPTLASFQANNKCKLYHWIQCDDTISEERLYIPVKYIKEDNVLEISLTPKSVIYQIDERRLRRWAWDAIQKEVEEVWLDDVNWSREDGAFGLQMAYLVDAEDRMVYGLKIKMWTQTGKVEECFNVPLEIYG